MSDVITVMIQRRLLASGVEGRVHEAQGYLGALAGLRVEIGLLRTALADRMALIEQQQDRIDLLERLLAPPGKRGLARLRPASWPRRVCRRVFGR